MKINQSNRSRKLTVSKWLGSLIFFIMVIAITSGIVGTHASPITFSNSLNTSSDFTLHSPEMEVTDLTVSSESNGTYYISTSTSSILNLTLISNIYGSIANISTPSAYGVDITIWATGYTATIYENGIPITLSNESLSAAGLSAPYSGAVSNVTIWGIQMNSENLAMNATSITIA